MGNQTKKAARPVLIEDELIPRLVHELKDALRYQRDTFDIASETGHEEEATKAQAAIKKLNALLEAVGPESCPYCDDNQGRLDGRGCPGCNLIGGGLDPLYDGRDGSLEQSDADREFTKGTPYEDA